jgi:Ca2+-binding RTX toxin-like protein
MAITEPNNTISSANDSGISPRGEKALVFSSEIDSYSDVDLVKLRVKAGNVVTVNIDALKNGSTLDSVVRVFDVNGNEKAVNDDNAEPLENRSLDSYLEYTADAFSDYYVGVSSYNNFGYDPLLEGTESGGSTGNYDLAINVFNGFVGTEAGDNLSGTTQADYLKGLEGNDTLIGNGQNDYLLGNGGKDLLLGGAGDDLLLGGAGIDVLKGGSGNDTLGGELGSDRLQGAEGADVFAIGSADRIIDFEDGSDLMLLRNGLTFADIAIAASTSGDTGTTLSYYEEIIATLVGIDPTQVSADDFVGAI